MKRLDHSNARHHRCRLRWTLWCRQCRWLWQRPRRLLVRLRLGPTRNGVVPAGTNLSTDLRPTDLSSLPSHQRSWFCETDQLGQRAATAAATSRHSCQHASACGASSRSHSSRFHSSRFRFSATGCGIVCLGCPGIHRCDAYHSQSRSNWIHGNRSGSGNQQWRASVRRGPRDDNCPGRACRDLAHSTSQRNQHRTEAEPRRHVCVGCSEQRQVDSVRWSLHDHQRAFDAGPQ